QVKGAIDAVSDAVGNPVEGGLGDHSVGRIVVEGLVAAQLQLGASESEFLSGDGTTHRHINYDARHI
ncbi:hypothetical protein GY45DRAFT_1213337, partial [Cubamyces sp. BRFM 1775]